MNKVFWRKEPLSETDEKLLNACFNAHAQSAFRDNISTSVMVNASKGSLNYTTALAAALCTLGGIHAPILQTVNTLFQSMDDLAVAIETGAVLPGWGHDFVKGEIDPLWVEVAELLERHYPNVHQRIEGITMKFHEKGKMIYPNPSAYTAAVGMALGIPAPIIPYLFVQGRLGAWTTMFYNTMVKVSPKPKLPEKEAA
jgi:citrate synthase